MHVQGAVSRKEGIHSRRCTQWLWWRQCILAGVMADRAQGNVVEVRTCVKSECSSRLRDPELR